MSGLRIRWTAAIRCFAAIAWAVLVLWALPFPALADPAPELAAPASQLFEIHCAGCHPGGGNIIRRGKTLKQKALKRNGVETEAAIATLIHQGKGIMPAFADRLSEAEIAALAAYVLEQAEAGW
jgi:cytochrome c6